MEPQNPNERAADQRRILVIDDEPLNVKLFVLALERRGYQVLQATNGYHGFVAAADERPDLIVMDVQMPQLSGLEVTRALKESSYAKDIPIVIATAFSLDEAELAESKCDGYVTKPFGIDGFIKLVDSLIERNRPETSQKAGAPDAQRRALAKATPAKQYQHQQRISAERQRTRPAP